MIRFAQNDIQNAVYHRAKYIGGQVGEEWWSWQRADLEKITPQAGA